eukprot:CFRG0494T1
MGAPVSEKIKRITKLLPHGEVRNRFLVAGASDKAGSVCYGCGGIITSQLEKGESVRMKKVQLKAFFHAMTKCDRCIMLAQDAQSKDGDAVARHSVGMDPAKLEVFEKEMKLVSKKQRAQVILVTNAIDFESSVIRKLRDYTGNRPVTLVVTKCDLLPLDMSDAVQRKNLERFYAKRMLSVRLEINKTFMLSGKRESGINSLVDYVRNNHNGSDFYVIGTANVGKSTLINALTKRLLSIGKFVGEDTQRKQRLMKNSATTSHLAGTTLMTTRIPCFNSHKHALFDTPGLFNSPYAWNLPQVKPSMLVPRVLTWPNSGQEENVTVSVPGQPIHVDICLPQRQCTNPLNSLVWYSPVAGMACVESGSYNTNAESIRDIKYNLNSHQESSHLQSSQPPEQNNVKQPTTPTPPERELDLTVYSSAPIDIVACDVGWLAMKVPKGTHVQVFAPPNTVIARQSMFSPELAADQLKFIDVVLTSSGKDLDTHITRLATNDYGMNEVSNPFMVKDDELKYTK